MYAALFGLGHRSQMAMEHLWQVLQHDVRAEPNTLSYAVAPGPATFRSPPAESEATWPSTIGSVTGGVPRLNDKTSPKRHWDWSHEAPKSCILWIQAWIL